MRRRNVVFPFRIIRTGSSAVNAGNWYRTDRQGVDADWLEDGGAIQDWSYDTELYVGRSLEVDTDGIISSLDIGVADPVFELIHSVKIGSLGQRKIINRQAFNSAGTITLEHKARLDSEELAQEITLQSTIILKQTLADVPPWSPRRKASRIWEDETRVLLEGSGSRFPMRDVDFTQHPRLPDNACWHLEWRPTLLHYSFNSAVTLYINSSRQRFVERVQESDEDILEQIMSAITCEICSYLLCEDDFVDIDINYPEGSLGMVARTWLYYAMPGMTLADIRDTYLRSPETLNTALRGLTAMI